MGRLLAVLAILVAAAFFAGARPAQAEPWLSTRFAQDCAGCHAPGRKNVVPIDRRCTLSCQGCHVNPNGGGLRSFYGKWNEERWLRTFRSEALKDPKSFAPMKMQHYGKEEKVASHGGKHGHQAEAEGPGKEGFPLVEVDNTTMPERLYTRADGLEKVIVKNREEFTYQIPQQDPYRLLDESKTNAGADIRWETTNYARNGQAAQFHSFLMTADFGLEWRPIHRHVHLVYEARMLGNPVSKNYDAQLGSAHSRSLYLMVDDLPFNVFVMGGYYRPLFGNFVPDHYSLAQEMTSFGLGSDPKNYDLLFQALSIGTAPNVPYLNVHLIGKQITPAVQAGGATAAAAPTDKTSGFALNTGLRFVTLGASVNYSYWKTANPMPDHKVASEMHSIGVAGKLWRTVTSIEGVSIQRDDDIQDFRQGGVWTLDTYTQLWKENYFTFLYAMSNTTSQLTPGSATQYKAGIRSFLLPGVDVWLLAENTKESDANTGTTSTTTGYSSQLHLYF